MTTTPSLPTASPPPDLGAKLPKLIPRKRTSKPRNAPSAPPPPTPTFAPPPDLTSHTYTHPTRRILSPEDHELFLKSPTCTLVQAFIFNIADSVVDRKVSSIKDSDITDTLGKILRILQEAEKIVEQCPPEDTGSRFGNPEFRTFLKKIEQALPAWHAQLGLTNPSQADEVSTYLLHSLGNASRIDYGSGHELHFFLWLLCLNRLTLLPGCTFPSLALVILPAYLHLMRLVQATYYLEPAGSHGVWGLDDYQFLPFLFGAAQLLHHPYLTPKSIHNDLLLEDERHESLYLDQIAYVNAVKTVKGLRWHSPMLDDVSAAKGWAKVEGGMRRVFVAEVLGKLPVMQHFLFGSLVPAVQGMSPPHEGDAEEELQQGGEVRVFTDEGGKRHVHASVGWGDCCGIRVPGAVGAVGEERKGGSRGLRRVPFD